MPDHLAGSVRVKHVNAVAITCRRRVSFSRGRSGRVHPLPEVPSHGGEGAACSLERALCTLDEWKTRAATLAHMGDVVLSYDIVGCDELRAKLESEMRFGKRKVDNYL